MGSSRFPGKPLKNIKGMPLIIHIAKRCLLSEKIDKVVVATCDEEIKGMVARYQSNTKEPNLTTGENATASTGIRYESMAQVKADMSNPKYEKDPAFRKEVEEKLARSTII